MKIIYEYIIINKVVMLFINSVYKNYFYSCAILNIDISV